MAENRIRLDLLLEKVEKVIRKLFHQQFSQNPHELYQELLNHGAKLKELQKKKKISKEQTDLLSPVGNKTNSSEFDTTLLLVLVFNFCKGFQIQKTGWKPKHEDRSESANLVRLRKRRNEILHSSFSISQAKYMKIFDATKQPLIDLGCTEKELELLKTCELKLSNR